jgi:hypothetical protein
MPLEVELRDESFPRHRAPKAFGYGVRAERGYGASLPIGDYLSHLFCGHASFTKSETSQSRSVTFAAMAGVMRIEE